MEIVGISFDSPEANKRFSRRWGLPFDLLSDVERKAGMAYGACRSLKAPVPKRITYLIDPQGRVARVWAGLKPRQHAQAVLEYLERPS